MAVTCLDLVPAQVPVCSAYVEGAPTRTGGTPAATASVPVEQLPDLVADAVGAPVRVVSAGPTAADKRALP